MSFARTIPPLTLTPEDQAYLDGVLRSRHETVQRVTRARFLRDYAAGDSIPTLVQR